MLFKKRFIFPVLMFSLASPHLMAASIGVPSFSESTVSAASINVNSIVRPNQFSTISNGALASITNQFSGQFISRPQSNFLPGSDFLLDSPLTGDVAISAVPLPAALWLFLPTVLGFFGLRHRLQTVNKRTAIAT